MRAAKISALERLDVHARVTPPLPVHAGPGCRGRAPDAASRRPQALDHVVSNIQAKVGVSLSKAQYLDSFLENAAGNLKDLYGAQKYHQLVDTYQVASSKHLSRSVQAGSVLFLDNSDGDQVRARDCQNPRAPSDASPLRLVPAASSPTRPPGLSLLRACSAFP